MLLLVLLTSTYLSVDTSEIPLVNWLWYLLDMPHLRDVWLSWVPIGWGGGFSGAIWFDSSLFNRSFSSSPTSVPCSCSFSLFSTWLILLNSLVLKFCIADCMVQTSVTWRALVLCIHVTWLRSCYCYYCYQKWVEKQPCLWMKRIIFTFLYFKDFSSAMSSRIFYFSRADLGLGPRMNSIRR